MSSVFGKNLKVSIFGQSHSKGIGMNMHNLPPGFEIDIEKLQAFMARRSAVGKDYATKRKEADALEFLSGIVDGKTCGAPLSAVIFNSDYIPKDYDSVQNVPRPGHADFTAWVKYKGFADPTGGGHFSGRLTAALCAAGGIAKQILEKENINIYAHIKSISDIEDDSFDPLGNIDTNNIPGDKQFPVLNDKAGENMRNRILEAADNNDSVGGIIECMVVGMPAGVGEPNFEGVENMIAQAIFAVPAVRGIEFGLGFASTRLTGSQHNDAFVIRDGQVKTRTNNHAGILGGITSSMPIIFRVPIKPTSSIGLTQDSVDLNKMEEVKLEVHGRHDPCITPRAVPVIEAVTALAVLDLYMSYRIWR